MADNDKITELETDIENLSLIPANANLSGAEIDLIGIDNREFVVKNNIKKIKNPKKSIIKNIIKKIKTKSKNIGKNITKKIKINLMKDKENILKN